MTAKKFKIILVSAMMLIVVVVVLTASTVDGEDLTMTASCAGCQNRDDGVSLFGLDNLALAYAGSAVFYSVIAVLWVRAYWQEFLLVVVSTVTVCTLVGVALAIDSTLLLASIAYVLLMYFIWQVRKKEESQITPEQREWIRSALSIAAQQEQ